MLVYSKEEVSEMLKGKVISDFDSDDAPAKTDSLLFTYLDHEHYFLVVDYEKNATS